MTIVLGIRPLIDCKVNTSIESAKNASSVLSTAARAFLALKQIYIATKRHIKHQLPKNDSIAQKRTADVTSRETTI
jgi:hypothetical protein